MYVLFYRMKDKRIGNYGYKIKMLVGIGHGKISFSNKVKYVYTTLKIGIAAIYKENRFMYIFRSLLK